MIELKNRNRKIRLSVLIGIRRIYRMVNYKKIKYYLTVLIMLTLTSFPADIANQFFIPMTPMSAASSEVEFINEYGEIIDAELYDSSIIYTEDFIDWTYELENDTFSRMVYPEIDAMLGTSYNMDWYRDEIYLGYDAPGSEYQGHFKLPDDPSVDFYNHELSDQRFIIKRKGDSSTSTFSIWNLTEYKVLSTPWTWATAPDLDTYLGDLNPTTTTWYVSDTWDEYQFYICIEGTVFGNAPTTEFYEEDRSAAERKPRTIFEVSKINFDDRISTYKNRSYYYNEFGIGDYLEEESEDEWVYMSKDVSFSVSENDILHVELENDGYTTAELQLGSNYYSISAEGNHTFNIPIKEDETISNINISVKIEEGKHFQINNISVIEQTGNILDEFTITPYASKNKSIEQNDYIINYYSNADLVLSTFESVGADTSLIRIEEDLISAYSTDFITESEYITRFDMVKTANLETYFQDDFSTYSSPSDTENSIYRIIPIADAGIDTFYIDSRSYNTYGHRVSNNSGGSVQEYMLTDYSNSLFENGLEDHFINTSIRIGTSYFGTDSSDPETYIIRNFTFSALPDDLNLQTVTYRNIPKDFEDNFDYISENREVWNPQTAIVFYRDEKMPSKFAIGIDFVNLNTAYGSYSSTFNYGTKSGYFHGFPYQDIAYNKTNYNNKLSVYSGEEETINFTKTVDLDVQALDIITISVKNVGYVESYITMGSNTYDISCTGYHDFKFNIYEADSINEIFIESNLDGENVFSIDDISIVRMSNTDYSFTLAPQSKESHFIYSGSYTVMKYENNIFIEDEEVDISYDVDNKIILSKEFQETVFLRFSNLVGEFLDFSDFIVSIEYYYAGFLYSKDLITNTFEADIGSTFSIVIKDTIFDEIIYSDSIEVTSNIIIELEVYSLIIHNLMNEITTVEIDELYIFQIPAQEYKEFIFPSRFYNINYTDDKGIWNYELVHLNESKVIELFRTYYENVQIALNDQNSNYLIFNNYLVYINNTIISEPVFLWERDTNVSISISNLDNELIFTQDYNISTYNLINFINIQISTIYIQNNADEQITAYIFNQSSVPTDFYTYAYLDSDYESYEDSSYIETFDSNSFKDTTISFENNSVNCPSLSVTYENQVDIGENNTFSIYPIKTVNNIVIVKIWNNITLANETLTELLGYYIKNFNSSYSHYYSVEIYIEDTSGYYNIMKIDDIFVLKNRIRIGLENLKNKYLQYSSLEINASLYKFDGTLTTESANFTLKYPNGTIIIEDQSPNLEYNLGYKCGYYILIVEFVGDADNLATSVETIFEVVYTTGQSYELVYFNEDPIFNLTIAPYSTEFHNMTSFTNEVLYVMYFDIYNNELHGEVFNFSTTNALDYTPELLKQCRITLTDQFSNILVFENYHVYINDESIYGNSFYRTVNSTLNITIYDLFGNILYDDDYTVEREDNFIDLILNQHSFKVLNHLQDSTILNITNLINPLSFVLSENIAVDELMSIYLQEGDYSIYYIDDSGSEHTLSITIDESRLLILNTTYHEIYFAFFDLSGFGVDSDTARFYINDERKELGYNLIQGDTAVIKVLDFFNTEIYDDTIILTGLKEFNIYLPIYTMLINNNYTESMELSIKRQGIDVEFKQIIPAQSGISLRFLANVEYGIKMFYTNGTLAESKSILLNEDYKQISFGFYEKFGDIHLSAISIVDYIISFVVVGAAVVLFVIVGRRNRADKLIDTEYRRQKTRIRKSPGDLLKKR